MAKYRVETDQGAYMVETDEGAASPDPRQFAPGVPKPGLPEHLQGPEDYSVEGGGNGPGLPAFMVSGLRQLGRAVPAFSNSPARGASDLIRGAAKVAAPLAIPAAVAAGPVATVGGLLGGMAGGQVGKYGAQAMGAGADGQNLGEDLGGVMGGLLGGSAGKSLGSAAGNLAARAKPYLKDRGVQDAAADMVPFIGGKFNNLRKAVDKVGGAKDAVSAVSDAPATTAPAAADSGLLDGIALGQAGKPFAKLDQNAQATVRAIAEKIQPTAPKPGGLLAADVPKPELVNRGLLATDFKTKAADRGVADKFHAAAEESGLLHGSNVTTKNRNLVEFAKSKGLPVTDLTESEYNMLVEGFNQAKVIDPRTGKPFRYGKAGLNNGPKQHGRSVADTLKHFNEEFMGGQ